MHKTTNKLNSICKCFTPKQQQQQEQQLIQKTKIKKTVDKVHQKQKRKENMRTNKNAKLINKPNNIHKSKQQKQRIAYTPCDWLAGTAKQIGLLVN